jgi:hypothetical protein
MLSEDELRDALLLVFANKQVGHGFCLVYLPSMLCDRGLAEGSSVSLGVKCFVGVALAGRRISLARRLL